MTIIDPARENLDALRDLCGGAVALPGDDGYDTARQGFNLAVDQRPAAVAFPADATEVAEIVHAARRHGLRVAPQATGHNANPLGDLTHSILVKTTGLGGVDIDPVNRIARAGAGTVWEDVVDAAAPHGLIALHGSSPNVGVVGYSLGGGMGWLARSHGLQANSVTAVELVTAEGALVRTDADHDPELFWALRGGGGNFGIVTAIEFRLYPVSEIHAGFMLWDWTHADRVLAAWSTWAQAAPDHVTTSFRIMQLPPIEELPEFLRGRKIVMIDGAVQGDPAVLDPLRALAPELDTFANVPAQSLARLHQDPEDPMPSVGGTALIQELPREAVHALLTVAGPGSDTPLEILELRQAGGALRRTAPGHGAASTVEASFVLFAGGLALSPELGAAKLAFIDGLKLVMEPWSNAGHYLNFAEEQIDISPSFTPEAFARLREVKDRMDPENVIHANHAI